MAHGAYLSLERNLAEEWLSKKGHIECECGLVFPSYIAYCQHKVQYQSRRNLHEIRALELAPPAPEVAARTAAAEIIDNSSVFSSMLNKLSDKLGELTMSIYDRHQPEPRTEPPRRAASTNLPPSRPSSTQTRAAVAPAHVARATVRSTRFRVTDRVFVYDGSLWRPGTVVGLWWVMESGPHSGREFPYLVQLEGGRQVEQLAISQDEDSMIRRSLVTQTAARKPPAPVPLTQDMTMISHTHLVAP